MKIEIGDKVYNVEIARTEEEKMKGLQGKTSLASDEGMLFIYEEPDTVAFWMKDTDIPLDIVFIDEDEEVISVKQGIPNDETLLEENDVMYVLEVNQNSGIQPGDELDEIDDDDLNIPTMKVLAPDGTSQMDLKGGERIVSRRETKILLKKAKAAYQVKSKPDQYERKCKSLGKYMFKVLKGQDTRDPEYVKSPEE